MIYIGYFDTYNSINKRKCSSAAIDKMNYIISIISTYENVDVFSCAPVVDSADFYISPKTIRLSKNVSLFFPGSFFFKNKILQYFNNLFISIWLFIFLLRNTKKNESVLVYHSVSYSLPVMLAKKIKKFKLILEVEEIYGDLTDLMYVDKIFEKCILRAADSFLFASDTLNEKVNTLNKTALVIYGSYNLPNIINHKSDDGKIHVIYAGNFDRRKGGAIASLKSSKYLDENYHMHICGFGTDDEVKEIEKLVEDLSKVSKTKITFEGLLLGTEYTNMLQKCHIGLSTQNPEGAYNESSFPSKIISYMANGLNVVSINIKAVRISQIGKCVSLYDIQSPEEIAQAIKDVKKFLDTRSIIHDLDCDFKKSIVKII